MRKTIFSNHCFFHGYNRGVEKRNIFMDEEDRYRFVQCLHEFNNQRPVTNLSFRLSQNNKNYGVPTSIVFKKEKVRQPRKLLVKIHCFVLMPNHFHLILEQLVDGGISLFMQKLQGGYTGSFNSKYNRVGPLFQGRFKAIRIDNENYLLHLSRYQHINPVELIEPNWKEGGIKDWKKVNEFLENYRWSSYLDYIGKKNYPSVTNRELINSYFKNPKEYKKFINDWLIEDIEEIEDFILEK